MSDIVERLRRHAEQYVGDMDTDTDVALFAAADEIERLRAHVNSCPLLAKEHDDEPLDWGDE